ncbi:MAG: ROK family protein [Phycisphaerales bacterium]|nr:ROK family protein [Phycisphaerales bacterium]
MSKRRCAIGVDLGGQSVRMGIVDAMGMVHQPRSTTIDARQPAEMLLGLILDQLRSLIAEAVAHDWSPVGTGIALPGYMDSDRSRIVFSANLPTLNGSRLPAQIQKALPLPVNFESDGNAAALAEFRFGAGQNTKRLLVTVIGTGIGGGVIIDGQTLRIWNHLAGSLGHVVVDARGPRCGCGARGCVEAKASGRTLERLANERADAEPDGMLADLRQRNGRLSGHEIRAAAEHHDASAISIIEECGWWLGAGIASWSAIFHPDKVLIGGGLGELGEPLLAAIRRGLKNTGQPFITDHILIERAALRSQAGLIGAGAMVLPDN